MKRMLASFFALVICGGVLFGCHQATNNAPVNTEPTSGKQTEAPKVTEPPEEAVTAAVKIECPPAHSSFEFTSYEELKKALTDRSFERFGELRNSEIDKGLQDYGKVYKETLAAFESGEVTMLIPQQNGKNIPLRQEKNYCIVTLDTSELYHLPWTWYQCIVDGSLCRVVVSYVGVFHNEKIDSAKSYLEVQTLLEPDAPSPLNFEKFQSGYDAIYEKELVLADGRTCTALIKELKDSSRDYVMFYQDGALIRLLGERRLFTEEFWKSFRMVPYEKAGLNT